MSRPAKRFEYAAAVDRAGRISAEPGAPLQLGDEWSPEALVLAGLARCTIASLRYHAHRAELDLVASAVVAGVVTRREEDGRYAFVEVDCSLDVELAPEPPEDELDALIAKGERDCFISASLRIEPRYRWTVNGKSR